MVSIHAPAWGATSALFRVIDRLRFQFTLPRGERPVHFRYFRLMELVSIHAPAWGATPTTQRCFTIVIVSIHAPAWGATITVFKQFTHITCFNSRSRVGSDLLYAHSPINGRVSIHAPAWGATTSSPTYHRFSVVSIHAPAWGATVLSNLKNKNV